MPRSNRSRLSAVARPLAASFVACAAAAGAGGCVTGSRPLSEMTAADVRDRLTVGTTTMDDVRRTFGEPQAKGVERDALLWYYHYTKVSGAFFIPIVNLFFLDDNRSGYLRVVFDGRRVVRDVNYRGSR